MLGFCFAVMHVGLLTKNRLKCHKKAFSPSFFFLALLKGFLILDLCLNDVRVGMALLLMMEGCVTSFACAEQMLGAPIGVS